MVISAMVISAMVIPMCGLNVHMHTAAMHCMQLCTHWVAMAVVQLGCVEGSLARVWDVPNLREEHHGLEGEHFDSTVEGVHFDSTVGGRHCNCTPWGEGTATAHHG